MSMAMEAGLSVRYRVVFDHMDGTDKTVFADAGKCDVYRIVRDYFASLGPTWVSFGGIAGNNQSMTMWVNHEGLQCAVIVTQWNDIDKVD